MDGRFTELQIPESYTELLQKYKDLFAENVRLRKYLAENGISYTDEECRQSASEHAASAVENNLHLPENHFNADTTISSVVTKHSPLAERISLFLSLFQGRKDVYARQWRGKDGKIGYSPACKNELVRGVCGKPKAKCVSCENAAYQPYDENAIKHHLSGDKVLGVYPLLPDDTCMFLAVDFDEATWKTDVSAMARTCQKYDIPCAVEISRSGNGAHFWMFFSEAIEACQARRFGSQLLSLSMRENARLAFSSYDRMFPNQDTMPKGGFGNLIALPFQREAFKNGGSVFVDDTFSPYPDQWTFLSGVKRINKEQIIAFNNAEAIPPLGELRQEADESTPKPWQSQKHAALTASDFTSLTRCIMADRLFIPTKDLSQRAQNSIKRLAAFRNPQFYQAQAMRMPIWNKPRVICCAEYADDYLCLPRGCREALCALVRESGAAISWEDERCSGKSIDVRFTGTLREEQQLAFEALLKHDDGVLSATTAFGKTVIGAALVGEKRVSTLILVHRKQLMAQWKERLTQFLDIQEELPEEPKKHGRKKRREVIGTFGGGNDTRGGIVDIAILQSLGTEDNIVPWISDYGMVIVDECHHVPAVSFESALKKVRAKYIYGLTATPTRQDGHHPILNMYLGPIRYKVDAKVQAEKRPFTHVMIPRFTGTRFSAEDKDAVAQISRYYTQIAADDLRNHLIVDDVLSCALEGRNCLLLSERTSHAQTLFELLQKQTDGVITLTGGKSNAETCNQLAAVKSAPADKPLIICATGKYIGEGFDESRLDTLFLTMPISWHGTLAQYAGRLHRLHAGKREVRVYDYVDANAEMLEKMYHKRLKGYAALGYCVSPDAHDAAVSGDIIYDQNTFQNRFEDDIVKARSSIVIVSPYATMKRVRWIGRTLGDALRRGVTVTVYTRPPEAFVSRSGQSAEAAINELKGIGVAVCCQNDIHQKFAVIDKRIVWYGSINLLSFGASQESIMRLVSGSVAKALER